MDNSEHQKIEDLEHLAKLKQDGVLNEHEFETEKTRILSGDVTLSEIQQEEKSANQFYDIGLAVVVIAIIVMVMLVLFAIKL